MSFLSPQRADKALTLVLSSHAPPRYEERVLCLLKWSVSRFSWTRMAKLTTLIVLPHNPDPIFRTLQHKVLVAQLVPFPEFSMPTQRDQKLSVPIILDGEITLPSLAVRRTFASFFSSKIRWDSNLVICPPLGACPLKIETASTILLSRRKCHRDQIRTYYYWFISVGVPNTRLATY